MSGSPNVTATNVTSTRADGAYQAGDVIDIVVTLPFAVTWSGQRPEIRMHTQQSGQGDTTSCGAAQYVDGNGTTTWRFEYRVRAGVVITDLSTDSIMWNGPGTGKLTKVSDSSDLQFVVMPTAAGSLSANKAITADTSALTTVTATSIAVDVAAGTYPIGEVLNFTVTFPEAITAMECANINDHNLTLLSGSTYTENAVYVSGSGTNTWHFTCRPIAGFSPLRVGTRIDKNSQSLRVGAGFRRANGDYCSVLLPAHGDAGAFSTTDTITVVGAIGTAVVASSIVTSLSNGDYNAGQVVDITVNFSGAQTLGTGANPTLLMLEGTSGRPVGEATYVSGSGSTAWLFNFTIPAGVEIDKLYAYLWILLNGNDIRDTKSFGFGSNTAMSKVITATTKSVSTLVSTALADATYDPPTDIDIVVTLPFATSLTGGTPSLPLYDGDTPLGVSAAYLSGSGTTTWTFRYTAGAGIVATDLRTGELADNGATYSKTSGGSAVTVVIRDEWINTLIQGHNIALSGIVPATNWTDGDGDHLWNNANNWDNGVPDETIDAIVAGAGHVIVDNNGACKSLDTSGFTGTWDQSDWTQINVYGDISIGDFTAVDGIVYFILFAAGTLTMDPDAVFGYAEIDLAATVGVTLTLANTATLAYIAMSDPTNVVALGTHRLVLTATDDGPGMTCTGDNFTWSTGGGIDVVLTSSDSVSLQTSGATEYPPITFAAFVTTDTLSFGGAGSVVSVESLSMTAGGRLQQNLALPTLNIVGNLTLVDIDSVDWDTVNVGGNFSATGGTLHQIVGTLAVNVTGTAAAHDCTVTNCDFSGGTALDATDEGVNGGGNTNVLFGPPVITSVVPATGLPDGNDPISINGTGFSGSTVDLDGVPCTSVVVVSPILITCVTPAHAAGNVTLTVTNDDDQFDTADFLYTVTLPEACQLNTVTLKNVSDAPALFVDGAVVPAGETHVLNFVGLSCSRQDKLRTACENVALGDVFTIHDFDAGE